MSELDSIIAGAVRRADRKKADAKLTKTKKRTPVSKQTHAVANENVHAQNSSARQADAVETIDRDSELPTSWKRSGHLSAPPPRPGFVQKWIRCRSNGAEDPENLEKFMDQGWRPVRATTARARHALTANTDAKYGQYIVKRGLILMELPEKLAAQRNAFYNGKLRRMTESIDRNLFKESDPRMPMLKPVRKTRVTTRAKRGNLEASIPADDE